MSIVQLKIDNVHNRKYGKVNTVQSQVIGKVNGDSQRGRNDQEEGIYQEKQIGTAKSALFTANARPVLQKSMVGNSKSSAINSRIEE